MNARFVVLERRLERRVDEVEVDGKVASAARNILLTCLVEDVSVDPEG